MRGPRPGYTTTSTSEPRSALRRRSSSTSVCGISASSAPNSARIGGCGRAQRVERVLGVVRVELGRAQHPVPRHDRREPAAATPRRGTRTSRPCRSRSARPCARRPRAARAASRALACTSASTRRSGQPVHEAHDRGHVGRRARLLAARVEVERERREARVGDPLRDVAVLVGEPPDVVQDHDSRAPAGRARARRARPRAVSAPLGSSTLTQGSRSASRRRSASEARSRSRCGSPAARRTRGRRGRAPCCGTGTRRSGPPG